MRIEITDYKPEPPTGAPGLYAMLVISEEGWHRDDWENIIDAEAKELVLNLKAHVRMRRSVEGVGVRHP